MTKNLQTRHPYRPSFFLLFFAVAILICLLHAQASNNANDVIPPHSDNLSYQNIALYELALLQKGELGWKDVFFGVRDYYRSAPPLYKWSLQLGYLVFGMNLVSPLLVAGLWLAATALAIFCLLRKFTRDDFLAFGTGLLFLGLPGVMHYGYIDPRNDWPATMFLLWWLFLHLESNFYTSRKYSLLSALALALALLTKSSLAGYILFPTLVMLVYVILKFCSLSPVQRNNIYLSAFVVIGAAGWFYLFNYLHILSYYSFWGMENKANLLKQYSIDTFFDHVFFYPKNLQMQLGPTLFLPSLAALFLMVIYLFKKTNSYYRIDRYTLLLLLTSCLGPYLILVASHSIASVADIPMVPFYLLFISLSAWRAASVARSQRLLATLLLALAIVYNLISIFRHNTHVFYNGIDQTTISCQIQNILHEMGMHDVYAYSLYEGIYFNSAVVSNITYRSPIMRAQTLFHPLKHFPFRVIRSSNTSAREKYDALASQSNCLLMTDRAKGPDWLAINQQWAELISLVENDHSFVRVAELPAYDDGTRLRVYIKQRAEAQRTIDDWILDTAAINVFGRPGNYEFIIEGTPAGTINQIFLAPENGGPSINGAVSPKGDRLQFHFNLSLALPKASFRIESQDAFSPQERGLYSDSRRLLLHKAQVDLVLNNATP